MSCQRQPRLLAPLSRRGHIGEQQQARTSHRCVCHPFETRTGGGKPDPRALAGPAGPPGVGMCGAQGSPDAYVEPWGTGSGRLSTATGASEMRWPPGRGVGPAVVLSGRLGRRIWGVLDQDGETAIAVLQPPAHVAAVKPSTFPRPSSRCNGALVDRGPVTLGAVPNDKPLWS